jgi:hypothetical protein
VHANSRCPDGTLLAGARVANGSPCQPFIAGITAMKVERKKQRQSEFGFAPLIIDRKILKVIWIPFEQQEKNNAWTIQEAG